MKKEKFNIEYVFDKASRKNLWNHLTTSSGLSEWFADDVISKGDTFEFIWNKQMLEAERLVMTQDSFVRFRWIGEEDEDAYFEFRLHSNELTGTLLLEIIDFAYPEEKEDAISLWDSQTKALFRRLGL
ncbi:MAG: hypothetical protein LBJ72_06710 [Dysgonamonadaceae bacterium]|jgi:uncharacterized protein YndB with AHSA1/START domain|nr:hypothetical protein [Dysgonamonadaceae bacterium]